MATKVGFIGLGRIGKPMAANVLKAGFDLMVYDIREEALRELVQLGARQAREPKELGEHADIVEVAVVDDAQVEDAVSGVLQRARSDTIIAIHSTILPATITRLASVAEKKGVKVLDAPVTGGEKGAEERQLCYVVGGEKTVFERCRPVLQASATHIFHIGDLGSGTTTKMILQVVVCINMLGAYEAELLCEKSGLDFKALQQVLRVISGQSFVVDHWLERFKRPEDPIPVRQRRTEVFSKSLSPALQLGHELGISLPGARLTKELLSRIMGLDKNENG